MKWDVWLKNIIKDVSEEYVISEKKSRRFFKRLLNLLK